MFKFDPSSRISPLADIEDSKRGTVIEIGAGSVIDSFVKIKPAGGSGNVKIGRHVYINSGTTIYTGNGIEIGDDTLIAANCTLAPTNHQFDVAKVPIRHQGFQPTRGGIVIGCDVWIGSNCVVLDGTLIGDGCVVGAASLVRGNLEPAGIYLGNPIRKVGVRGS